MVRPLETSVVFNLEKLGLKRIAKVKDVFDWQPAGEQEAKRTAMARPMQEPVKSGLQDKGSQRWEGFQGAVVEEADAVLIPVRAQS